jgi:hypothetical protein
VLPKSRGVKQEVMLMAASTCCCRSRRCWLARGALHFLRKKLVNSTGAKILRTQFPGHGGWNLPRRASRRPALAAGQQGQRPPSFWGSATNK